MALLSDEVRETLIQQVLFASSQAEVKHFIDDARLAMEKDKVNKHVISGFVDHVINDLSLFTPLQKQVQEWSNIKAAKILLNRIKVQLNTPAD
jgi:hypothetical protein